MDFLPIVIIGGALLFAAIVSVLHHVRRDVEPATRGISHYAVGRTRGAMTGAFVALALGMAAAAASVGEAEGRAGAPGAWLLALSALGLTTVALVPVPERTAAVWRGPVHVAGAFVFFVTMAAGAVAASSTHEGPVVRLAQLLSATVGAFLASMVRVPALRTIPGYLQRVCFALTVLWLSTFAASVCRWPRW